MKVRDLVKHVLRHVNAEVATRDPSQVAGIAARAQYVRAAVASFRADVRDLPIDTALGEVSNAAPLSVLRTSFRKSVANMLVVGETRPQLAVQTWVGKNREQRGG